MQIGGGMGEEYMRAPTLNIGGGGKKGGGSFIASILDLLGIHKQVAKEPDQKKDSSLESAPVDKPQAPQSAPPPPGLSVLDEADQALGVLTPQASRMGKGFKFNPLNTGFGL